MASFYTAGSSNRSINIRKCLNKNLYIGAVSHSPNNIDTRLMLSSNQKNGAWYQVLINLSNNFVTISKIRNPHSIVKVKTISQEISCDFKQRLFKLVDTEQEPLNQSPAARVPYQITQDNQNKLHLVDASNNCDPDPWDKPATSLEQGMYLLNNSSIWGNSMQPTASTRSFDVEAPTPAKKKITPLDVQKILFQIYSQRHNMSIKNKAERSLAHQREIRNADQEIVGVTGVASSSINPAPFLTELKNEIKSEYNLTASQQDIIDRISIYSFDDAIHELKQL